jgi:hypothetical protein
MRSSPLPSGDGWPQAGGGRRTANVASNNRAIEVLAGFIGNVSLQGGPRQKKRPLAGPPFSKRQMAGFQAVTKVGAAPVAGGGHKRVENRESRSSNCGLFINLEIVHLPNQNGIQRRRWRTILRNSRRIIFLGEALSPLNTPKGRAVCRGEMHNPAYSKQRPVISGSNEKAPSREGAVAVPGILSCCRQPCAAFPAENGTGARGRLRPVRSS